MWQLRPGDFTNLSTELPSKANESELDRGVPWLLHSLSVNALNFCAFSMCREDSQQAARGGPSAQLIASPNGLDLGGIDIFQLPSEKRVSQIKSDQNSPTGMVMGVLLFNDNREPGSSKLVLVAGYEDGRVMVYIHQGNLSQPAETGKWQKLRTSKPHTQPILSLDILPSGTHFLTSGADATIAKFSVPLVSNTTLKDTPPEKSIHTRHAGQQGLSVRSDSKIFATAGWDGRVRVYSCKTMKEPRRPEVAQRGMLFYRLRRRRPRQQL